MSTVLEKTCPEDLAASTESSPKQPRIVIIGGGLAGILHFSLTSSTVMNSFFVPQLGTIPISLVALGMVICPFRPKL
jgi:hypothetical protein